MSPTGSATREIDGRKTHQMSRRHRGAAARSPLAPDPRHKRCSSYSSLRPMSLLLRLRPASGTRLVRWTITTNQRPQLCTQRGYDRSTRDHFAGQRFSVMLSCTSTVVCFGLTTVYDARFSMIAREEPPEAGLSSSTGAGRHEGAGLLDLPPDVIQSICLQLSVNDRLAFQRVRLLV